MKARRTLRLCFPQYKAVASVSPFFLLRQRNVFYKTLHLDAYKAPASASPFLTAKGDEMPSKKTPLLDECCHVSMNTLLMQYFTKKLSLQVLHHQSTEYCTIKDSAQTLACSKKRTMRRTL